ncbi:hypothetical protein N8T08_003097 [Aspergillus melleus]|uniref:Uncharacterized protein n=1 Tax=Aspergillus melleus TaxID=138277 RepID=A0ACC3B709_9EURO|nr:hypothetical protein N8T08_003097 [Aspergillus melleus]
MPPPLVDHSDDESTGESIPFNDAKEIEQTNNKAEESAGDDGDDDEEGVYIVEKIVGHEWAKNGSLLLAVKWKGYDDPVDQTMEPEENLLEGAEEVVKEYFKSLGGRPTKPQAQGRKRKSMTAAKQIPEKTEPKRRRKSQADAADEATDDSDAMKWVPKSKSWEAEVENVDTIMRDPETSKLIAYLQWKNGKKSKVSIESCYDKCPKKMLKFYEQHLVFKDA